MLPHDDPYAGRPAPFCEFRAELLATHAPADAHERVLVEEFIEAAWEFRCAREVGRYFWEQVGGAYRNGAPGVAEAQFQEREARFRTHLRYRAEVERSYYRALAAIERLHRSHGRNSRLPKPSPKVAVAAGPAVGAEPLAAAAASAASAANPAGSPSRPAPLAAEAAFAAATSVTSEAAAGPAASTAAPTPATATAAPPAPNSTPPSHHTPTHPPAHTSNPNESHAPPPPTRPPTPVFPA